MEAERLYGRRSAHLSLSLRGVKARVEVTEFGSLKTSRTHTHFPQTAWVGLSREV